MLGKKGYEAVSGIWELDDALGNAEARKLFVEDITEDVRFIYQDPDAKVCFWVFNSNVLP